MNSIHEMFTAAVASRRDRVGAQYKDHGAWRDVTWGEMERTGQLLSAGLVKLGVAAKERVSIYANTRLEWILADIGVLGAGGTTVPIYQSSTVDDAEYILNDAGVVAVFAEDAALAAKLRSIQAKLPGVKKVVVMSGEVSPEGKASGWEMSWDDLLELGEAHWAAHEAEVKARAAALKPSDLLTLIYTSGTTGRPKGTMLTHDNMLYEAEAARKVNLISPDDVQYLFLPMAHVFAKVLEVVWFREAHVMAFWEGDMKKIVDNLGEVRPTLVCAVPRIFEKIYAKTIADASSTPGLKGHIVRWGLEQGVRAAKLEQQGGTPGGVGWALAQKLVWSKIHERLLARFGGRIRFFVSGGAPLSRDIAYFFKHAGFKICEGYGLTETSAATTINLPHDIRIGSVGRPMPGTEIKIAEDGEILIRGRGVMIGYYNKADATKEALDDDGWFHSGDIGNVDKDGFVRITDRKKDIIVTAGGKNVAPQNIENLIKSRSALISQAVVHGDQRKFLSVVLTVDEENVRSWAKQKGIAGDYKQLTQAPELLSEIGNVVKDVNNGLASYESLKKFKVLDHDFSVGDQLTPSLKVKRKICNERYKDIFDSFYADPSAE